MYIVQGTVYYILTLSSTLARSDDSMPLVERATDIGVSTGPSHRASLQ